MGRIILLLLVPIIVVVIAATAYVAYTNTVKPVSVTPSSSSTPFEAKVVPLQDPTVVTKLTTASPNLIQTAKPFDVSQEHIANIQLSSYDFARPNAFQIKLGFVPTETEILEVKLGDLWSETNILQNTLDSSGGIIKFAAGQGFGAEQTKGIVLFTITYRSKSSSPKFLIHPESKLGYVNQDSLTTIKESTLVVKIIK